MSALILVVAACPLLHLASRLGRERVDVPAEARHAVVLPRAPNDEQNQGDHHEHADDDENDGEHSVAPHRGDGGRVDELVRARAPIGVLVALGIEPDLVLPDRRRGLQRVDRETSGLEGFRTVW